MKLTRRSLLRAGLATFAASAWPLRSLTALAADAVRGDSEFFVFVHAAGGWDVTLWSDPRNAPVGTIAPATSNVVAPPRRYWTNGPTVDGARSFEIVRPPRSKLALGPAIGALYDLADRITVVNGLAMNTVSHPDGIAFSATGRHLVGAHAPASSVDTVVANELGRTQLLPAVSVRFPSFFAGEGEASTVVPLAVDSVDTLTRALARSAHYEYAADRDEATALLEREARALEASGVAPDAMGTMALQLEAAKRMNGARLEDAFSAGALQKAYPSLPYRGYHPAAAVDAAFAVEAFRRDIARCVSFAAFGFDTHGANYRFHTQVLEDLFDVIGGLVAALDRTPHPTRAGAKLADHTHILVISDFCRTPQINGGGGRDHYPNNSALVISPRFRGGEVFGGTDDELLPAKPRAFAAGSRPIAPPDLLATFLASVGVAPARYVRDGEVVREMLRA